MNSKRKTSLFCYIAAAIFCILSVICFFIRRSELGILFLLLGSFGLCLGSFLMMKSYDDEISKDDTSK